MMETTFIYALCEPDTRTIRYIGKADNPEKRLRAHVKRAEGPTHKNNWLCSILAASQSPKLVILREVPQTEWQEWEQRYIQAARCLGMDLTNSTDGGENPPSVKGKKLTPSHRAKISAAHKGKTFSLASRKKMSEGRTGPKNHRFGKKLSVEESARRSAARRGSLNPMFGKKHTPEHSRKTSNSLLGQKRVGASSKFTGVSWNKERQKWRAGICGRGVHRTLGLFVDEISAALAYNTAARDLFGADAKLNILE